METETKNELSKNDPKVKGAKTLTSELQQMMDSLTEILDRTHSQRCEPSISCDTTAIVNIDLREPKNDSSLDKAASEPQLSGSKKDLGASGHGEAMNESMPCGPPSVIVSPSETVALANECSEVRETSNNHDGPSAKGEGCGLNVDADNQHTTIDDCVDAGPLEEKLPSEPSEMAGNLTAEDVQKLFPSPEEFLTLSPAQRQIHADKYQMLPLEHKRLLGKRQRRQLCNVLKKMRERNFTFYEGDSFTDEDSPAETVAPANEVGEISDESSSEDEGCGPISDASADHQLTSAGDSAGPPEEKKAPESSTVTSLTAEEVQKLFPSCQEFRTLSSSQKRILDKKYLELTYEQKMMLDKSLRDQFKKARVKAKYRAKRSISRVKENPPLESTESVSASVKADGVDAGPLEEKLPSEPSEMAGNLTAEEVQKLFPSPEEFITLSPAQRQIHADKYRMLPLEHKRLLGKRQRRQLCKVLERRSEKSITLYERDSFTDEGSLAETVAPANKVDETAISDESSSEDEGCGPIDASADDSAGPPEEKKAPEPLTVTSLTAEEVRKMFPSCLEFLDLSSSQRLIHVKKYLELTYEQKMMLDKRLRNQFKRTKDKAKYKAKKAIARNSENPPLESTESVNACAKPDGWYGINSLQKDFPPPCELRAMSDELEKGIIEKYLSLGKEQRKQLAPAQQKELNKLFLKVGFSFVKLTKAQWDAQRVEMERVTTVEQRKTYGGLITQGYEHREALAQILGVNYVQSIELMDLLIDKATDTGIGEWNDRELLISITTQIFPSPALYYTWPPKLKKSLAMKFDKLNHLQKLYLTKNQRQMLISTLQEFEKPNPVPNVRHQVTNIPPLLSRIIVPPSAVPPNAWPGTIGVINPGKGGWGQGYSMNTMHPPAMNISQPRFGLLPVPGPSPFKRQGSLIGEPTALKRTKFMEGTDQYMVPPLPQYHTGPSSSKEPTQPAISSADADGSENFNVYIVPSEYPNEVLTEQQMDIIESTLLEAVLHTVDEAMAPTFEGSIRNKGRYKVTCSDQFSKEWLVKYVRTHQLWPNASLKVIVAAVPEIRATASLPLCNENEDKILKFILVQNKGLNVGEWKVVERRDCSKSTTLTLVVDEESASVLRCSEKINFKFGKAAIRILDEAESSDNPHVVAGSSSSSRKPSSHKVESSKLPERSKPKATRFTDRSIPGSIPVGQAPRYMERSKSGTTGALIDAVQRSKLSYSDSTDRSLNAPSSTSDRPGQFAFSIFPTAIAPAHSSSRSPRSSGPLLPTPVRKPMPSYRVGESKQSGAPSKH